jgi:hypothetical protein
MISCEGSKRSGERCKERVGWAIPAAVGLDSGINLNEKSCCRFAADAAIGDDRLNRSLRPTATQSTDWVAIDRARSYADPASGSAKSAAA